jgi:hypothetical protein
MTPEINRIIAAIDQYGAVSRDATIRALEECRPIAGEILRLAQHGISDSEDDRKLAKAACQLVGGILQMVVCRDATAATMEFFRICHFPQNRPEAQ